MLGSMGQLRVVQPGLTSSALGAMALLGLMTVNGAVAKAATPPPTAVTPAPIPAWITALKLSPDQIQKVQAIEVKFKPQARSQQIQLNQAESLLESLLVKGASNEDIRAQHQVIQNYRRQLEVTRLEAALEIKDVLTPAQRQQLAELNQQRLTRLRDLVLGSSGTTPR
ncbi:Spy/CpxP family protein refolding chaperone [Synechococcus sp. PCC 6312]|uniref:Spy/CpxP family protein refolding chaperone n=1 Tax=Synechococcus sp. (strain ATCC 27167 / PCC 6312) TaxID=195253 RepID=UPI00029EC799|nr:Spy/CpxP family protein refolding chaperone [Synechococcus sp. PCC 6312]AFY59974.1 P pilus assembly/Cpx signaling pathway, periplasmic inhibitor/zinc-resistance associated protein [Synechococcus sp. PCC 6312]